MLVELDIGLIMGLMFAPCVLAVAVAFRLLEFPDLSVEGSFPLGAAIFASAIHHHLPLPIAIGAAALGGALVGTGTAVIHSQLGLNKFLAAILMVAICYSLGFRVMGAPNLGLLDTPSIFTFVEGLDQVSETFHAGTLLLLAGIVGGLVAALLAAASSRSGLSIRVAGTNPEYARSLGIRVAPMMVVGLAAMNALSALSGALLAMYQGFADVSMGQGQLVFALAGMMIGERLLPRSMAFALFVALSAVAGSLAYHVIVSYALRLDLTPTDLKLVTAVFVLGVMATRRSAEGEGLAS